MQMVEDYTEHWNKYRRIRNQFWLIFLGYLPVGAAAGLLASWLHLKAIFYVCCSAWMILFLIAINRLDYVPCPRCGKPFARKWWYTNSFLARKCVHCRLPKYAADSK
jgi:hypothetical protein